MPSLNFEDCIELISTTTSDQGKNSEEGNQSEPVCKFN